MLSVIVPTLNSEKYIGRCLTSIMMNDRDDYEIIIVDGGSTDQTIPIIYTYLQSEIQKKYHHITLINSKDKNEPDAINKGLKYAIANTKADIFAYLDSDDEYSIGTPDVVQQYFHEHPECLWLYGKYQVIDRYNEPTNGLLVKAKEWMQEHYHYNFLQMTCFVPQPSVFLRRQIVEVNGYFDINEKYVFDYEYWLRIGKIKPHFINQVLSYWRVHPEGTSVQNIKKAALDSQRIALRYCTNPLTMLGAVANSLFMRGYYGITLGHNRR